MFNTANVIVYSNKIELGEALPNYLGVIESAKESSVGKLIEVTKEMVDTCKRVSIFAEGLLDKYCKLQFGEKNITIIVQNSNIGEITENFEITVPYENEEVTVDLLLFQSILEHSKFFELSPKSETREFPVIRAINDNLEIIQITLNMEEEDYE